MILFFYPLIPINSLFSLSHFVLKLSSPLLVLLPYSLFPLVLPFAHPFFLFSLILFFTSSLILLLFFSHPHLATFPLFHLLFSLLPISIFSFSLYVFYTYPIIFVLNFSFSVSFLLLFFLSAFPFLSLPLSKPVYDVQISKQHCSTSTPWL